MVANLTQQMESSTRKKIDLILNNLGWNTDEDSSSCNVFTERTRTSEEKKKLAGKSPDYVLYDSKTNEPIAIIEAKKRGQSIDAALAQGESLYANPLGVKIIFAYDGAFFKSWHTVEQKELSIDGEAVIQLLSEKKIRRFLSEGAAISEATPKVKHTRAELINIFKWANDLLRKEGLREGIERFTEFANILFLKLISEIEEDRKNNKEPRLLEDKYCWKSFADLDAERMLEYINGTILPHLVQEYNRSGDVFETKLSIKNAETLHKIVEKLSELQLINSDSDVKGDAFEYFLKNSVTVGNDLGEYFTPRHIVRLMVNLINPRFGDKVYDPTCGTGGFIIEAFRHIKSACKPTEANIKILKKETIYARELTNTAKIAKMNMIIAGDGHTNIKQMESLGNRLDNEYEIVLANIPYGQATDFGSLYPVFSRQADCVFVQHIILSLKKTDGRAAIIVPEGFLFRAGADRKTREYLLSNYSLIAVISLPEGVFLPYTDSKTDILILESGKRTENVWFYDLKADGFELSMTRKPIPENDIGDLISKWSEKSTSNNSWSASIADIAKKDYNLQVKTYRPSVRSDSTLVSFSSFLIPVKDKVLIEDNKLYKQIKVKLYGKGAVLRDEILGKNIATKIQYLAKDGYFIVSKIDARNGAFAIVPKELDGAVVSSDFPLFKIDEGKVDRNYFDYLLRFYDFRAMAAQTSKGTTNRKRVGGEDILNFSIRLPSIEFQRIIVERISKQNKLLSDLDSYIENLEEGFIDEVVFDIKHETPTWTAINQLATKTQYGITARVMPSEKGVPLVRITDIDSFGRIKHDKLPQVIVSKGEIEKYRLSDGDLLVARSGSIGKCAVFDKPEIEAIFASYIIRFVLDRKKVEPKFVLYYLLSNRGKMELTSRSKKMVQTNINAQEIGTIPIPVIRLEKQREIIRKIDEKLRLVDALELNRCEIEETIKKIVQTA